MLNNELSMCSTQCAKASESTLRLMSGWGWNETVSCVSYSIYEYCEDVLQFATVFSHNFFGPCTRVA